MIGLCRVTRVCTRSRVNQGRNNLQGRPEMLNKYRVLFMSATTVLSVIVGGLGWHSAAGQVQGASELVFTVP